MNAIPMKIGLAGLGVVGAEVARQLIEHSDVLASRAARPLKITAVSARKQNQDRGFSMDGIAFEQDPTALARRDDVDVVVELMGGEDGAALELVTASLSAGKPVVTANKALLAKHARNLAGIAEEKGVNLLGEASVAGGIPILKMLREGLGGNRVNRISGILNGTCNYILSTMEDSGRGFEDVLAEAQTLGYAEADPSFDIDGIDAGHKLALLGAIGFGISPDFDAIEITGIRSVTEVDVSLAAQLGFAIRLLATAEDCNGQIVSSVQPSLVAMNSKLAKVDGALNAVEVQGDPIGHVIAIGPGAGAGATASAVLADLIDVARGRGERFFGVSAQDLKKPQDVSKEASDSEHEACYYLRLKVIDRPGVLAEITSALSQYGASVNAMVQQAQDEQHDSKHVDIVLTTHATKASILKGAAQAITALDDVVESPTVMVIAS